MLMCAPLSDGFGQTLNRASQFLYSSLRIWLPTRIALNSLVKLPTPFELRLAVLDLQDVLRERLGRISHVETDVGDLRLVLRRGPHRSR